MSKAKSWEQYKAECEVVAKEGITILGFVGTWKGIITKLICHCDTHGQWESTNIEKFLRGTSCRKCRFKYSDVLPEIWELARKPQLKLDKETKNKLKILFPLAKFVKSEKKDSTGRLSYLDYGCKICSNDEFVKEGLCTGIFTSRRGDLLKGVGSCRCSKSYQYSNEQREYQIKNKIEKEDLPYTFLSWDLTRKCRGRAIFLSCKKHGTFQSSDQNFLLKNLGCPSCKGQNQNEGYINSVLGGKGVIALKFGIAKNSEFRLKGQNRRNKFKMRTRSRFIFPNVRSCKEAERACLQELECGILTAKELKDGWTETTSIQNLDKIIEIYERFGGVRVK